jgi:tetratricopeptide (TPR) repeat protein
LASTGSDGQEIRDAAPMPTNVAGFIAGLRALKVRAGNPSFEELRRRSGVPRSTLADALKPGRGALPRLQVVTALLQACDAGAEEIDRWDRAWKEIQNGRDGRRGTDADGAASGGLAGAANRNFLPADLSDFTGRGAETDRLLRNLGRLTSRAAVISAIDGMAGIGKTTLAVHVAHQLAPVCPDGQFFLNLHGHTPGREPLEPARALHRLLRLLGVAEERIPEDLEDRSALWRAELGGRSVVLVLDNAADADQIRPLLPGGDRCLTLITSRRRMVELHEAATLSMEVMPLADAVALFNRVAGESRVEKEQAAVAEVVRLCGFLPLAIRIAAARLRHRPRWTVEALIERLREQLGRTRPAEGADQVAAAFEMSYRRLGPAHRSMFRLLGLHPGPDIDPAAAAALTLLPARHAEDLLEDLLDHLLIEQHAPRRYTFHDLLRGYSADVVRSETAEPERRRALSRLLDHYRYSCADAMDLLYPHEHGMRPHPPRPDAPIVDRADFADTQIARAWLEAEMPNLLACAVLAVHQAPEHTGNISTIVYRYLDDHARYADALTLHTAALRAADHRRDGAARLQARLCLGAVSWRTGRYPDAIGHYQQALSLARASGDRANESRALANLGLTYFRIGRYHEAIGSNLAAIEIARETGNRLAESHFLGNLSRACHRLGRYPEALEYLDQALGASRETGDRVVEGRSLCNLGVLHGRMGRHALARELLDRSLVLAEQTGDRITEVCVLTNLGALAGKLGVPAEGLDPLDRSLTLAREVGDSSGEAHALTDLGTLYLRMGRYAESAEHQRRALVLARRTGEKNVELEVVNGLGEVSRADGASKAAIDLHRQALALAEELDDRFERARAHLGLGDAHHELGARDEAEANWRLALELFSALGVPEAGHARRRLGIAQVTPVTPCHRRDGAGVLWA